MKEAVLLAVTMEQGPQTRDTAPLEAGKGQKQFSLELLEEPAQPSPGFSHNRPMSVYCEMINVLI